MKKTSMSPNGLVKSKQIITNAATALACLDGQLGKLEQELLQKLSGIHRIPPSIQQIDLMIQSVSEIQQTLERLAENLSDDALVDPEIVIAPIKLEAVRNIFLGHSHPPGKPQVPREIKAIDLFDD